MVLFPKTIPYQLVKQYQPILIKHKLGFATVQYKGVSMAKKQTPMMEQYLDIKARYPDELLFFRLGDFYELFNDDALVASRELNITLTGRPTGDEERTPMCGVPFHAAESYIETLVKRAIRLLFVSN